MDQGLVLYSKKKDKKALFFLAIALTFFLIFIVLLSAVYSADMIITGTVKKVLDGDTIHLLPSSPIPPGVKTHKDGTVSVRFRGIDAPEKRQLYGQEAKRHLETLIDGKNVKVEVKDIDRYGRIAGYVYLNDKNINLEQIKAGYAWAYSEYLDRPYASTFYEAEKETRKTKRGLWIQPNPQPPWEYRKTNK